MTITLDMLHRAIFNINSVRTTHYGLKGLQIEAAKSWGNVPSNIKKKKLKASFNSCFKQHIINQYVNN